MFSPEQLQRMEENRQRALMRRRASLAGAAIAAAPSQPVTLAQPGMLPETPAPTRSTAALSASSARPPTTETPIKMSVKVPAEMPAVGAVAAGTRDGTGGVPLATSATESSTKQLAR